MQMTAPSTKNDPHVMHQGVTIDRLDVTMISEDQDVAMTTFEDQGVMTILEDRDAGMMISGVVTMTVVLVVLLTMKIRVVRAVPLTMIVVLNVTIAVAHQGGKTTTIGVVDLQVAVLQVHFSLIYEKYDKNWPLIFKDRSSKSNFIFVVRQL
jgi:hypothetical protein